MPLHVVTPTGTYRYIFRYMPLHLQSVASSRQGAASRATAWIAAVKWQRSSEREALRRDAVKEMHHGGAIEEGGGHRQAGGWNM